MLLILSQKGHVGFGLKFGKKIKPTFWQVNILNLSLITFKSEQMWEVASPCKEPVKLISYKKIKICIKCKQQLTSTAYIFEVNTSLANVKIFITDVTFCLALSQLSQYAT